MRSTAPARRPSRPATPVLDPTYGVPPEMLHRAWTMDDVMAFTGLKRTAAYRLMQQPTAPQRLNTGGAHRWNGAQVLTFLHRNTGDTTATGARLGAPPPDSSENVRSTLNAGSLARSTGVTPDGVATFTVDPAAVASAARRSRVTALVQRPPARRAWAAGEGVTA